MGIQRFPNLLRWTVLACRLPYPGGPKSAHDCCFLLGVSLHLLVTGSATTLVVSRLQSSLRAQLVLLLRPASWLALLSRTFTFELSLAGSPRANVEYDYVGKQSIPTAGLSPASPTALWAAPSPEILNNKRNSRLQFSGTPATGFSAAWAGKPQVLSHVAATTCSAWIAARKARRTCPKVAGNCSFSSFFEHLYTGVNGVENRDTNPGARDVSSSAIPRRRSLLLPLQAVR